jgi:16S rRNA processing protein RimM
LPEPPEGAAANWVAVALLGKPRGYRGELTAIPLGDKPERYEALKEVYLFGAPRAGRPELAGERFQVESLWFHRGGLVLKFLGVDDVADAVRLVGAEVRVPLSERVPLDPGEFFQSDLMGCEVVDRRSGVSLGRVLGWQDAGGAGLLVVEGGWLIPFARAICVEIDPAAKRIAVELPAGLKELNQP